MSSSMKDFLTKSTGDKRKLTEGNKNARTVSNKKRNNATQRDSDGKQEDVLLGEYDKQ